MFINIDLSTLENHPGMAHVVIGAFFEERALFRLDEAAQLGDMRVCVFQAIVSSDFK